MTDQRNYSVTEQTNQEFVIARTFDAPRDLVWKAFMEPERMKQWFGPKGFAGRVAKMDFRVGGMYHYCLQSPDGKEIWGRFIYREIDAPKKIVFINCLKKPHTGLVS